MTRPALRDDGVLVVGAGVAGLAAAKRLRKHGVPVVVLEATRRIGGRAWTSLPPELDGAVFDHGATWLHAADRNPLAALERDRLLDADASRTERLFVDGRPATPAEQAGYDAAWERLETVVAPALEGPDRTLAEAMRPMQDDPWAGTIATWEGAIIAAADADELGVQDWRRNTLEGPNLQPPEGIGAFVARRLAGPVWLHTGVSRLDWGGRLVRAETARGTVSAAAAIVTVSTGVLAADEIRFDPPLPPDVEAAIHALPMGLLTKVALHAPDRAASGIAANSLLVRRDGRMTFNAWTRDRPYVTGFVGGRTAWSLAGDDRAAVALAVEELRAMLGYGVRLSGRALVTGWGVDRWHRGAYAYARPGDAEERAALAGSFVGERLLFAGEACRIDGLAGTVGGAYLSGQDAADRLLAG